MATHVDETTTQREEVRDHRHDAAPVEEKTVTLVEQDQLVADVSIDGLCGVY